MDFLWALLSLCIFLASSAVLRRALEKRILYRYSPLRPEPSSIRLLRLLPHADETAVIQCELFDYSLQSSSQRTHQYEALSYVWGSPEGKLPIMIGGCAFDVTVNLHAALLRMRNHAMERVLWVDAICIDQDNLKEKEDQIQFMAEIFGQARQVVVWLGEAAEDSDLALEQIRSGDSLDDDGGSVDPLNDDPMQQAILALLERPWFRRIWILQEVAAARHILVMCGAAEIDGHGFCLGVDLLEGIFGTRADLHSLIRSVTYLMKGAIFRPVMSKASSTSRAICPLGELMDMYHSHEATKRHDKVYALLGMSSDDHSKANLSPNYGVPWEDLLQRLVKFLLPGTISVETWGDQGIASIRIKGCMLGYVSSTERSVISDGRRSVEVVCKNISGELGDIKVSKANWNLKLSATPVQKGDLICLLQGASKPTIIRVCKDCFTIIIMITVSPPEIIQSKWNEFDANWPKNLESKKLSACDFLLVWDW
ncbi:HET-domain-containing protein, partial [Lophium mytilinum]